MNNIDAAFHNVKRDHFLPETAKSDQNIDAPIPIGFGQTNSQPTTVRMMLQWLDPQPGYRVLDVGSGSGWTTALLAFLIGAAGKVYAVERIPELVKFGADNCKRAEFKNVHFFQAGSQYGLPDFAPYDRILVSAAADKMPDELPEQLKAGGKMVIPIRNSILVITKTDDNYITTEHYGFSFVPLI